MAGIGLSGESQASNPLDVVERIASDYDWIFDRRNELEMAIQVPGSWCDYSLYFAWNSGLGAMHFTCAFDMRVPADKRSPIHELLALVNEKLWLGYFGLWGDEGLPMYRHALPLRGAKGPSQEQMEDLVDTAIMECERFYPAFQHVIWGGKSPTDAITSAMIDTVGEA